MLALPPECWRDPNKRHFPLNEMNPANQAGSLLVEFVEGYIEILRQGTSWVFLEWDEDKKELLPTGIITDFQYQVTDPIEEVASSHQERGQVRPSPT